MSDLKERIVRIVTQPQLATLATVTLDGKPWVRYVFMVGSDDLTIRNATFVNARKVEQIKNNNDVHLTCGVQSLSDSNPYLQIQGKAQLSTDAAVKKAFWNPGLQEIFEGPTDPNYAVIITKPYCIEYCVPGIPVPEVWTS